MALPNLTTETMVALSDRWLDPKKQRDHFTALPLLTPLLSLVEAAHGDLVAKQKRGLAVDEAIAAIQREEARRDARHDRKIRGAFAVLSGFADLTDDPDKALALLDLRDRLLPIGLKATIRSYIDEAGDAKRLPSRLDEASKALLHKMPTPDGPLHFHVDAWTAEAAQIGILEERRDSFLQDDLSGGGGPTAGEMTRARNEWIRVARAVESNLALEHGATPEVVESLLGPLRRAEARADQRRSGAMDDGAEEAGAALAGPG